MRSTAIFIGFFVGFVYGCQPIFRLYESRDYGDDYVENAVELTTISDVRDIAEHGLTHAFLTYTCPTGVWVGFRYKGYVGYSNVIDSARYSASRCRLENDGRVFQSLRIVGNPNDYRASAVMTFLAPNNEMNAFNHLNDTQSIPSPYFIFRSLILMGSQEMEIFTEENYTGTSFCVGPNNGFIWDKRAYDEINDRRNGTELYTNLSNLDRIFGISQFRSLKFGCNRSRSLNEF